MAWGRKTPRIEIAPVGLPPPNDPVYGPFSMHWEKKDQPDPGTGTYAWESLGLESFSPIGPAIANRGQIISTSAPVYTGKAVPVSGIPLIAGQVILQPLYDPNAPGNGYTAGLAEPLPRTAFNFVETRNDPIPTNAVTFGRPL